jgi:3-dehydroquinate synthase
MLQTQLIEVEITSKQSNYPIFVGTGILSELQKLFDLEKYTKVVILTDQNVFDLQVQKFEQNLVQKLPKIDLQTIVIPAGEKSKNLQTVSYIWSQFQQIKLDRKSLVIVFGGGVVGDLGGFCSSTYMRGMDFVQIPTTLLAQVDSSVGGKTGFDFLGIKNLIGTFSQPKAVFCDLEVLQTLPKRELIQGFGEVLKYGLIADLQFWNFLKEISEKPNFDPTKITSENMLKIVTRCCQIKQDIVQKDEKETTGLREILNFGHTFGHALESYSLDTKNPLFHGEAVAIGMVFALELSVKTVGFDPAFKSDILKTFGRYNLPISYNFEVTKNDQMQSIFEKLKGFLDTDKKNSDGDLNWVLLSKIGSSKAKNKIEMDLVRQVFDLIFREQVL